MNAAIDKEKHADSFLIENRHQFWWFPQHDLTIFLSIKKNRSIPGLRYNFGFSGSTYQMKYLIVILPSYS